MSAKGWVVMFAVKKKKAKIIKWCVCVQGFGDPRPLQYCAQVTVAATWASVSLVLKEV